MRLSTVRLALVPMLFLSATACGDSAEPAAGDDFPSEAITWVVPYAAGGNTDSISRTVAQAMSEDLGQDVVVVNKPGGSGAIGMQEVQSAKPDGHTVGLFTTGTSVVTPLVNDLGYSHDDFTNIGLMLTQPVVFMTMPDSELDSMEALVSKAKDSPGAISIGVPGATTPQAFEIERMANTYDTEFTVVPFDSNAEVINALRGGNVDAIALNASQDVQSQLESGDLRPLAVGEAERLGWLPETPTLQEVGFEDLTSSGTFIGLTAPKDLPEDVLTALEEALSNALAQDSVQQFLGPDNVPDEFVGSAEIGERLSDRRAIYDELIEG